MSLDCSDTCHWGNPCTMTRLARPRIGRRRSERSSGRMCRSRLSRYAVPWRTLCSARRKKSHSGFGASRWRTACTMQRRPCPSTSQHHSSRRSGRTSQSPESRRVGRQRISFSAHMSLAQPAPGECGCCTARTWCCLWWADACRARTIGTCQSRRRCCAYQRHKAHRKKPPFHSGTCRLGTPGSARTMPPKRWHCRTGLVCM